MPRPKKKQKLVVPKIVKKKKPESKKVIGGLQKPTPEHYMLPDSVIEQVAEHAHGAFYIITFDDDKHARVIGHADDPALGEALKSYCIKYFRGIQKAERTLMEKSVFQSVLTRMIKRELEEDSGEDGEDSVSV